VYAELRGARLSVAAAQRRQDEEVRQPLIGAERDLTRVAEVRDVEDVEQLEVCVDRLLLQRTQAVREPAGPSGCTTGRERRCGGRRSRRRSS
jgi:hypothetical protein